MFADLRDNTSRKSYLEDLPKFRHGLLLLRENLVQATARELAVDLGVSHKVFQNIYHGRTTPRYEAFLRVVNRAADLCEEIAGPRARHADDGDIARVTVAKEGELPEALFGDSIELQALNVAGQSLEPGLPLDSVVQSHEIAWKSITTIQVRKKISAVAACLDDVLLLVRGSNSGAAEILTPLQRSQLIAMLETTLALLKTPMIEVGLFRRIAQWLRKIVGQAAEKEVESALGAAADHADHLVSDLLDSL